MLPSRAAEIFINVISNLSDETSYNEENVINIYNMFTRECDKLLIENEKSIQEIFSNKQAISKKIHLMGYTILRSDYKTVILERLFAEFGNTNADLLANLIFVYSIIPLLNKSLTFILVIFIDLSFGIGIDREIGINSFNFIPINRDRFQYFTDRNDFR